MTNEVHISQVELLKILSALETTVVSLEKIGLSDPEGSRASKLYHFIQEQEIYAQLATARRLIWEACDKQLTESQRDELEQQLAYVSYWTDKDEH